MKKLIALFCIASAVTAFADDYTSSTNVFGVLSVNIGSEKTEAIISVPWLEPSTGDENIAVTNVIKTANLAVGDWLYYYDTGVKSYKAWQLQSGRTWKGAQPASGEAGADQTLVRGNAILLKAGTGNLPSQIFLYGQVAKTGQVKSTMAKGTKDSKAYTLIAPPSASSTCLNSATWTGVGAGDYIISSTGKVIVYVPTTRGGSKMKWGFRTGYDSAKHYDTYDWVTETTIPVGQGAWYVSANTNSAPAEVTWTGLPSVGE